VGDVDAARALVAEGRVLVAGAPAPRPARLVDPAEAVHVLDPAARYVSRGGEKLHAALANFAVPVADARWLDAGSSTGGFTDCLLAQGARQVVAVDVGRGQLHQRLRTDPRVVVRERTHVRDVDAATLGGPVDGAVADLSFIGLASVLGLLLAVVVPGAPLLVLVKPQFEARRSEVDRGGGVITDPAVWQRTLGAVIDACLERGASIMGVMASPLRGADGNAEFFVALRAAGEADRWPAAALDRAAIADAVGVAVATAGGNAP
jgi:23S rRNA (cytidine1920-2'-O)/16S rRNA (cytidine1409-2'-O)-methyltransferase